MKNPPGVGAPLAGTFSVASNVVTFTPATPMTGGQSYSLQLYAGAKDLAGNPIATIAQYTFTANNLPIALWDTVNAGVNFWCDTGCPGAATAGVWGP